MQQGHEKHEPLVHRARKFSVRDTLKDGTAVTIRALRPADLPLLREAFRLLDRDSIYTRFFTHRSGFSRAEIDRAINVDFVGEVALVVTTRTNGDEVVLASGRYIVIDGCAAEVAVVVVGTHQGRGIASRLLARLAELGRGQGLRRFEADVLSRNAAMLSVFKRCGLPMRQRLEGSVIHVTLALDANDTGAAR